MVLGYEPSRLEIAVEDDGRGLTTATSGGHGLVGVRERVALYDGTVAIGPVYDDPLGLVPSAPAHPPRTSPESSATKGKIA